MSQGFNTARAEQFAKRHGISYEEACRRLGRMGGRRRARPLVHSKPQPTAPARRQWWQDFD